MLLPVITEWQRLLCKVNISNLACRRQWVGLLARCVSSCLVLDCLGMPIKTWNWIVWDVYVALAIHLTVLVSFLGIWPLESHHPWRKTSWVTYEVFCSVFPMTCLHLKGILRRLHWQQNCCLPRAPAIHRNCCYDRMLLIVTLGHPKWRE